jgi:hypothetical protein
MADETKELLIKISATTELLRSQLSSAERQVSQFESRTNRSLSNVDRGFAQLGKGFSVGKAALAGFVGGLTSGLISQLGQIPGALINAANSGLEYASSLGEQAQALGVSTRLLQEFRFAVEQNGGTVEEADNALGKFSVTLGKAFDGGKEASAAFTRLGVDVKQLQAASDSRRFEMVADAIARIKDPAQQSSAAMAIFGKGARAIIPTLQAGAEAFRAQAEEARNYGLVLSDEQIQNADKTADKIQALNRALQAKIAGAVADNAAAIGNLTNSLVNLGTEAVNAANRYLNFRKIAALGAGGETSANAARDLLSTREGRNQLYNSIVDRQRRGVLTDGAFNVTSPAERARNRQILEGQRQSVIRAEVAARRLDAAREKAAPRDAPITLNEPHLSGGGGGSRGGASRSRLSALKKDADDALPTLQEIRDLLNDIDINPTAGTSNTPISQAFGEGEDFIKQRIEARDRLGQIDLELENDRLARGEETMRSLAGLYQDLFTGGTKRLWQSFQSIGAQVIAELLAKFAIAKIAGKSFDFAGTLTSAFGNVGFSGLGFAKGGRPPVGKASLVGERGPELFIPSIAGTVIPNNALGGTVVEQHFDLRGALVDRDVYADMHQIAASYSQAAIIGGAGLARKQAAGAASRRLGR